METCAECKEFLCEYRHPYSDQAMKPHNTKVFNLCRIKTLKLKNGQRMRQATFLINIFMVLGTL